MPSCHPTPGPHCHTTPKTDWLLRSTAGIIAIAYLLAIIWHVYGLTVPTFLPAATKLFVISVFHLLNTVWWGIALGIIAVAILGKIPKELITKALGDGKSFQGILRATLAGTLFDLCSHGILLVGMKLYERGASTGQVMAFLIASPWNSFSLTFILWSLIGLKWTIVFVLLSLVVAVISGMIFNYLENCNIIPANPYTVPPSSLVPISFRKALSPLFSKKSFSLKGALTSLKEGYKESTMVLRWLFLGIILGALLRSFVSAEQLSTYFGPTLIGLALTLVAATLIEVCSEGSVPIATDLLLRAHAPGNCFAFLMTGVSTDYTEIMALKQTTKSWKTALFLPLVTIPQILLLGWILNGFVRI